MANIKKCVGQLAEAFDGVSDPRQKNDEVNAWLKKTVPLFTSNDCSMDQRTDESEMAKLNAKVDNFSTNIQAAAILGLFNK